MKKLIKFIQNILFLLGDDKSKIPFVMIIFLFITFD